MLKSRSEIGPCIDTVMKHVALQSQSMPSLSTRSIGTEHLLRMEYEMVAKNAICAESPAVRRTMIPNRTGGSCLFSANFSSSSLCFAIQSVELFFRIKHMYGEMVVQEMDIQLQ